MHTVGCVHLGDRLEVGLEMAASVSCGAWSPSCLGLSSCAAHTHTCMYLVARRPPSTPTVARVDTASKLVSCRGLPPSS